MLLFNPFNAFYCYVCGMNGYLYAFRCGLKMFVFAWLEELEQRILRDAAAPDASAELIERFDLDLAHAFAR